MCFSASASFTAATILTVIGAFTLKRTTEKRQLFLALIPWIFAFQQFVEGAMWLTATNPEQFQQIASIGKYLFLFVALIIWPIWISLSFLAVEKHSIRRNLLFLLLLLGIVYCVVIFVEYKGAVDEPTASIIGHSISYQLPTQQNLFYYGLYLTAILIPPFISSLKYVWIFGILNIIGLLVTQYLFAPSFISVWCFFAALISLSIYFILDKNFPRIQKPNSIDKKG